MKRDTLPMQSADPRHRWIAAGTIFGVALLAVGLAGVVRPYAETRYAEYVEGLSGMTAKELHRDYRLLSAVASAGLAIPLLVMAGGFTYQAVRTQRASRYPYPGMWILRDTPIETGECARRRTRSLSAAAAGFAVLSLAAGWFLFDLFMRALESEAAGR